MTTPTTPAPMTAEINGALERLRKWANAQTLVGEYATCHRQNDINYALSHIDALTARIAELERELGGALGRLSDTQTELAISRKPPEDGEVAEAVDRILGCCLDPEDASQMPDAEDAGRITCGELRSIANLLTRQAAALKEAERERDEYFAQTEKLSDYGFDLCNKVEAAEARALAAEAKLRETQAEFAIQCRAIGNWREWPDQPETNQAHQDWKVATKAR